MVDNIKRRRKPVNNKPKKVVSLSMSGIEGYKALEILESNTHTLGKSGLVIDLVNYYDTRKKMLGITNDDEMIAILKKEVDI